MADSSEQGQFQRMLKVHLGTGNILIIQAQAILIPVSPVLAIPPADSWTIGTATIVGNGDTLPAYAPVSESSHYHRHSRYVGSFAGVEN